MIEEYQDIDRRANRDASKNFTNGLLTFITIGTVFYTCSTILDSQEKKAREAEPPRSGMLKGVDPTRDVYEISGIDPVTLEVYYDGDRAPEWKLNDPHPAPPVIIHGDPTDLTNPDVVEQILQTADFYDLLEKYAD